MLQDPNNPVLEKHYVGEYGTLLIVNCGTDTSLATGCYLNVIKPDGTTVKWTATPYIYNGVSNYLSYVIQQNDLSISGNYLVNPFAYLPGSGWVGFGTTVNFTVYDLGA